MRAAPVHANVNGDDELDHYGQAPLEPGLDGPPVDIADGTPLPVKVIRSTKRTKTSAAKVVDGVIEVRIPSWMDDDEEAEAVNELVDRIEQQRRDRRAPVDLDERAFELGVEYDLPRPASIRWVNNQNQRWGSCSIQARTIRVSSRLSAVPPYVLDYVLLHELTHLVEPNHTPEFHALMARYPQLERAEGFLEAMTFGCADDSFVPS